MAIKKGAFELYTLERKLPEKRESKAVKSTHFFDDVYSNKNGSQSDHDRSTGGIEAKSDHPQEPSKKVLNSSIDNGSQIVHDRFMDLQSHQNEHSSESMRKAPIHSHENGSRLVYERFTERDGHQNGQSNEPVKKVSTNNHNNGSQLVRERFTEKGEDQREYPEESAYQAQGNGIDNGNGSQLVHERFTKTKDSQIQNLQNLMKTELINNNSNGSQSVHDQGRINDLLNQIAILMNNNGSQSVHEKSIQVESNIVVTQDLESEKIPKISFSKLVGNQREIIISLYKNMKINKSDTTDELTLESISNLTGVNQKSLKNTLFRLNSAGVLIRADQKVGRGGWVKYKINKSIIKEIQQKEFLR